MIHNDNNVDNVGMPPPLKAEYIYGQRGSKRLVDPNGFTYWVNHDKKDGTIHWVCDQKKSGSKCKARITTTLDDIMTAPLPEHNHPNDSRKRGVAEIYQKAKECARSGTQCTTACLITAKSNHPEPVIAAVSDTVLSRQIRRWKQNEDTAHPSPSSLQDIVIPEEIQYRNGPGGHQELFLLHDSGPDDPKRFLVFGTQRGVQFMEGASDFYCDGTFKMSPPLFTQICSISVVRFSKCICTLYALLPTKSEEQYDNLFEWLHGHAPNINPKTLMTDFELAPIKSFLRVFGEDVDPTACFFHLCQNVWRHIKATPGMEQKYNTDADYAHKVRQLPALAFLPTEKIIQGFETLTCPLTGPLPEEMQGVIDTFEDYYIGRMTPQGRRVPQFPPYLWSQYSRTKQDMHRTNNCVEGHHHAMNCILQMQHPSISKLISGLKDLQVKCDGDMAAVIAGHPFRPPSKKYRSINQSIKTIVDTIDDRTTLEFLGGIAHNFNF